MKTGGLLIGITENRCSLSICLKWHTLHRGRENQLGEFRHFSLQRAIHLSSVKRSEDQGSEESRELLWPTPQQTDRQYR